ncbi:DNA-binding response regulator, NarL/FixJ family, contains REC and HTH domains [Actinacidiphila yanglinensis]|uniref:DNA-binding response regulator, NarL/FixJ family, contains REC and HTH domains n=1 Tax=Actinacidiphila yanglinensis TaxID=310779 RepID=A0A1H6AY48_9ACTN|nr:response regulator transcription factor [Actinacidiphila yanglinensis]SEG53573.1 DNA-binding response regulator, NarL/FixJ family, contains REC and HTH domains [Actinacidiphila yanglinensis]
MRVVIAEDLALLRDGLTRLLSAHGFDVAGAVGDPEALAGVLDREEVDVAIVDVRMPPTFTNEGLVAALQAREKRPGLPVVVLSQYVEQLYARELLRSGEGAIGYLLKDRVGNVPDFVETVRQVAGGATILDPKVVAAMVTRLGGHEPLARLTPREREVLSLMAEGRSNAGIGAALVITENAVSKHINSIFTKLDLPTAPDDNRRVLAVLRYLRDPSHS